MKHLILYESFGDIFSRVENYYFTSKYITFNKNQSNWYNNSDDSLIEYDQYKTRRNESVVKLFNEELRKPQYNIDNFNKRWKERVEYIENHFNKGETQK